jgi:hypothetical protein
MATPRGIVASNGVSIKAGQDHTSPAEAVIAVPEAGIERRTGEGLEFVAVAATAESTRLLARHPTSVVAMANTDGKRRAKKKQQLATAAENDFESSFDPGTALEVLLGAMVRIEALSEAAFNSLEFMPRATRLAPAIDGRLRTRAAS